MRFPLHSVPLAQVEIEVLQVKKKIRSSKFCTIAHCIWVKSARNTSQPSLSCTQIPELSPIMITSNISPRDSTKINLLSLIRWCRKETNNEICFREESNQLYFRIFIFTLLLLCGKRGTMTARLQSSSNAYSFPPQKMGLEVKITFLYGKWESHSL